SDALKTRIGAVVNLEARGGGGRAMMFETGKGNGAMIELFTRHVRQPSAMSMAVTAYDKLPNKTDYTVAKGLGIPGFNFAFIGDAGLYHSPLATPEALDARSVQDMGAQALDLTRALLTVAALPAKTADAVFSDVAGGFVIAYPAWVGWLLLGAAAALIGVAARRARSRWHWGEIVIGAGVVPGAALVGGGLIFMVNLLSLAAGKPNYYDRLAALPRIEAFTLLLLLATLALVMAALRGRHSGLGAWIGVALFNLLLAAAVQLLVPGVTPLFTWPLLLGALALAAAALHRGMGTLTAVVTAAIGLALVGGTGHFVLLALGDAMPALAALLLPMVLL
ncbi:MAG: M28 family peptidase, partial [Polymorphobacter sp.]